MGGITPLDGREALAILRALPVGVTVIDVSGNMQFVNEAAAAMLGTSPGDLVGRPALHLTVAASDARLAEDLLSTVSAGERWIGRFPMTSPDGRRIDTWLAAARVGEDVATVSVDAAAVAAPLGLDAVERLVEQSRIDAEEANRLLSTLLDAVPVGMAFFDQALRYVRVNRALAEINGLAAEAHVGKRIGEVLTEHPEVVEQAVRSVFETGATTADQPVSDVTQNDPGSRRHWMVSYFPVHLRGEVAWVGTTVVDVTEWRRNEQDRARALQAEQAARQAAEAGTERLARLQAITARFAEATTLEDVADVVIHGAAGALDAAGAGVLVTTTDSSGEPALRIVKASGYDPVAVSQFETVLLDAPVPVAEAARERRLVVAETRAERDERWPALAQVPTRSEATASLPLFSHDRLLGAITFGWLTSRTFGETDRYFMDAISRQCGLALERVRLYEAERSARAAAEESRERMTFLAEASRVLASSLDYRETLAQLAHLAVKDIADVCSIHVFDERGELQLAGAAHRDPDREPQLQSAAGRRPEEPRLVGRVAASGMPIVIEEMTDELVSSIAQDDEHAGEIRALGMGSGVVVPILSGREVLGVLAIAASKGARALHAGDLPFVEDIAARVAVTLENSRTHAARNEAIQTLQQSLLPPVEPRIPGLDLAQKFHTASELDLGGDFFDVFPSGDGRWGVVMGDVCGRGVGAAALTALARYTVRAGAIDEGEPVQVLHLLNKAILETETGERFCTLTHAIVEPLAEGATVTLACGGHPLPLLLRADGIVEEVGVPGTAIGLFEDLDVTAVELKMGPGDAIAFFTDGYTEARAPDGRFAPDLLERTLAAAAGGTAKDLVNAIDKAVLAFEGGNPRDDMALLVVRVPPR